MFSAETSLELIKWGVLLMWALWMTLVTIYNVVDALKGLGRLPGHVRASSNLALIRTTTAGVKLPGAMIWALSGASSPGS